MVAMVMSDTYRVHTPAPAVRTASGRRHSLTKAIESICPRHTRHQSDSVRVAVVCLIGLGWDAL